MDANIFAYAWMWILHWIRWLIWRSLRRKPCHVCFECWVFTKAVHTITYLVEVDPRRRSGSQSYDRFGLPVIPELKYERHVVPVCGPHREEFMTRAETRLVVYDGEILTLAEVLRRDAVAEIMEL